MQYVAEVVVTVTVKANNDQKARERVNLLCKGINLKELEKPDWIEAVDLEVLYVESQGD